jgi:hypothetical protein
MPARPARKPALRLLPSEDARTLRQLARESLDVQDACNLSGVVHSYSRAMSRLWELLPGAGTQTINHHPIARLWADKCAHLTGTQTGIAWVGEAYAAVRELAGERDERADS